LHRTLGMLGTEFVVRIVVYLTNRLGVSFIYIFRSHGIYHEQARMKFVDFAFDVLIFGVDGFKHIAFILFYAECAGSLGMNRRSSNNYEPAQNTMDWGGGAALCTCFLLVPDASLTGVKL